MECTLISEERNWFCLDQTVYESSEPGLVARSDWTRLVLKLVNTVRFCHSLVEWDLSILVSVGLFWFCETGSVCIQFSLFRLGLALTVFE